MPTATETAFLHVKPEAKVEEIGSPAAQQLKKLCGLVSSQRGFQRQFWVSGWRRQYPSSRRADLVRSGCPSRRPVYLHLVNWCVAAGDTHSRGPADAFGPCIADWDDISDHHGFMNSDAYTVFMTECAEIFDFSIAKPFLSTPAV